ncbi:hypothetical protein C4N9_20945 [Pararhodobacter marinus]|uniref:Uncharacterized protein n=1 Tax=Pararhodobacter marinus TaxID=2184063 RepID=A0A2U2C4F7_9RHOB|nr:hypothetical protein [Pararhodobacter marinus]PWE26729.1 hypothetical protein C4N9_20945 [Pararhodobacter marinus]
MTRLEFAKERQHDLMLPEVGFRADLINDMIALNPVRRIGPKQPGWDGLRSVDWPEMQAYAASVGADWCAWDFQTVYSMSAAFLTGLREGADPLCIPPTERASR